MALVLVAGAALKGTLDCRAATRALAQGVRRAGHEALSLPIADGGDGSLAALAAAGFRPRKAATHDALGGPVEGRFAFRARDQAAAVEFAEAAGLWRLAGRGYNPWRCTSYGVGELLAAAASLRPRRLLLLLGGSATQDGGLGLLQALGAHLRPTTRSRFVAARDLAALESLDLAPARERLAGIAFEAAHDVDHVLSGPGGSAYAFALQKHFAPEDLSALDAALGHLGALLSEASGLRAEVAGAGAAGGAGAAARALGARLVPGADCIFDFLGVPAALASADAVLTSEGQVDATSWLGKAPGRVCALAREAGKPAAIVCGRARAKAPEGVLLREAAQGAPAGAHDLARAAEAAVRAML